MGRIGNFDNYLSLGRLCLVVHGTGLIDDTIPFADFDWLSMEAAILMTSFLL